MDNWREHAVSEHTKAAFFCKVTGDYLSRVATVFLDHRIFGHPSVRTQQL